MLQCPKKEAYDEPISFKPCTMPYHHVCPQLASSDKRWKNNNRATYPLFQISLSRHGIRRNSAKFTYLLVSQMITFPSKPDVTSNLVLVSYSMFFTQLVWPCKVHTFVSSFLRSQSAIVVSSEQVANSLLSRNLQIKWKGRNSLISWKPFQYP